LPLRTTLVLSILLTAFAARAVAAPVNVAVDPSQIPDGTYSATVERIVDAKHIVVRLDNGTEAALSTSRANVDFTKAHPNDHIKLSLIKGAVAVYATGQ